MAQEMKLIIIINIKTSYLNQFFINSLQRQDITIVKTTESIGREK